MDMRTVGSSSSGAHVGVKESYRAHRAATEGKVFPREGRVAKIWKVSIPRGEWAESVGKLVRVSDVELMSEEPEGNAREVDEVSGGKVRDESSKLSEDVCREVGEQQTDEATRSSGPEGVRFSAKAEESWGKESSVDDWIEVPAEPGGVRVGEARSGEREKSSEESDETVELHDSITWSREQGEAEESGKEEKQPNG